MHESLELTPTLSFEHKEYELLLNDGIWHLYRHIYTGPRILNNFGHFLILKADTFKEGQPKSDYHIQSLERGRNLCACFGNQWCIRDKYAKLVSGATHSMTYQPYRSRRADERAPTNLSALRRLSLDAVFDVLAGQ